MVLNAETSGAEIVTVTALVSNLDESLLITVLVNNIFFFRGRSIKTVTGTFIYEMFCFIMAPVYRIILDVLCCVFHRH